MSKRIKKDIKNTSAETDATTGDALALSADQTMLATGDVANAPKKRAPRKAKTAVIDAGGVQDEAELQSLLLQVDHMLTEMTQSKWLSSDWPSLEIDLGSGKK